MKRLIESIQGMLGLGALLLAILYLAALSNSPTNSLWPAQEHWEGALVAGVVFAIVCILIGITTPSGR